MAILAYFSKSISATIKLKTLCFVYLSLLVLWHWSLPLAGDFNLWLWPVCCCSTMNLKHLTDNSPSRNTIPLDDTLFIWLIQTAEALYQNIGSENKSCAIPGQRQHWDHNNKAVVYETKTISWRRFKSSVELTGIAELVFICYWFITMSTLHIIILSIIKKVLSRAAWKPY